MSRYECKLTPDLLKKAVAELREPEDNDVRLAEIDKLRERFLEEQNEMDLLRSDDAFILRFLRAKKFNQQKAYDMLVNYHIQRKTVREVFDKVDNPNLLMESLENGSVVCLEKRAPDGSAIVVGRPGVGMPETASMTDELAMIVICIEHLLNDESIQICGISVIVDYSYCNFNLVKQFTPSLGKKFGGILGGAMPSRMKSMNIVNELKIFSIIYAVMRPFTKQKMQDRLQLFGTDYKALHDKFSEDALPHFLGGSGPDLDVKGWKRKMLSTVGEGEDTSL